MTQAGSEHDALAKLMEEFLARCRRGERPSIAEFAAQHPSLAAQIQELFPAVMELEQFGSVGESAPSPRGPIPARLGDYRILRELGRGGMGVVYEAVQESLGRHVALKVLSVAAVAAGQSLERFRREAQAAARLHHTNIVPVFGVGEDHGVHYYAMQFIHGRSLEAVLQELLHLRRLDQPNQFTAKLLTGRFELDTDASPPQDFRSLEDFGSLGGSTACGKDLSARGNGVFFRSVARMGVQVADALAHAHQQGILHRDIKPSNLLLDTQGTVWVADFGLAKADESDGLTRPGDILGTLRFMAPERFAGRSDPRSDIYALGITLYEFLTLRRAFADDDRARLIERIQHAEPPPPRRIDPTIPRDLETIVRKAMAKEPGDRYATASAMADDLRRFLLDQPIQARPAGALERGWRWCRRNRALAALGGAVLLLLVMVVAGSIVSALVYQGKHEEAAANLALLRVSERDKTARLADSLLSQAEAGRSSGKAGQRLDSLRCLEEAVQILRPDVPPPDQRLRLRNSAIACMALTDLRVARWWDGCPPGTKTIAFDANLERYARADDKGRVSIRRVADDKEIAQLPSRGFHVLHLRFSPDGRLLAVGDMQYVGNDFGRCTVWDWEGDKIVFEVRAPANAFDFAPDSQALAASDFKGVITCYDLATRQPLASWPTGKLPRSLAYDPSGRRLAIVGLNKAAVYACQSGTILCDLAAQGLRTHAAWHPDGNMLATAGPDGVALWNVKLQRQIATLSGHVLPVSHCTFNPTGQLLASKGYDGAVRLWDPLTGRQLVHDFGAHADTPLQFSRNGSRLAAAGNRNRLGIWEISAMPEYRSFAPRERLPSESDCGVRISPDGRLLASTSKEGLRIWDLTARRELKFTRHSGMSSVLFPSAGDEFLTTGVAGVLRWRLHFNEQAGLLRVDPPQDMNVQGPLGVGAMSRDGRTLAVIHNAQQKALVMSTARLDGPRRELAHPGLRALALSPDGRWAATADVQRSIRIWETASGALAQQLSVPGGAKVAFTADSSGLLIGTLTDYQLWQLQPWRQRWRMPRQGALAATGHGAFSNDGRLLAVELAPLQIQLVDPATMRSRAGVTSTPLLSAGMLSTFDGRSRRLRLASSRLASIPPR